MQQDEINRIRAADFSLARRGYDKDEVDRYLADLADRLEQVEPARAGSESMRRELELMGRKTAELLAQAEESAERLRAEATRDAGSLLARSRQEAEQAQTAAEESRQAAAAETETVTAEADAYAERVRAEADADAKTLRSQAAAVVADAAGRAEAEARREVETATEEHRDLQVELTELLALRDAAIEELRRIAATLAEAIEPAQVEPSEARPESASPEPPAAGPEPPAAEQPLRAV